MMRLRNFTITKAILRGGVANAESIPPELLKKMYEVGHRNGHYRAFISLLRKSGSWEAATKEYRGVDMPVRLVWGDKDWATLEERTRDHHLVPCAEVATILEGGHFLPLDRPDAVVQQIEIVLHSAYFWPKKPDVTLRRTN